MMKNDDEMMTTHDDKQKMIKHNIKTMMMRLDLRRLGLWNVGAYVFASFSCFFLFS